MSMENESEKSCIDCRHCVMTTIYKRCPHAEASVTAGDDGILRPTNALRVWVRPNFTEFEKIGVCELNHCETQDDHFCDHFEEGEEPEKIEVIKRPKSERQRKWDNMRAEQEAYEHLNPAEVE